MPLDLSGPFAQVEKIAKASKARRMLYSPAKYLYAILYRKILSHFLDLSTIIKVNTFFDRHMLIRFPAGTDIYLTGGKTDDAELRLTRFLFSELGPGDQFIDIGAHFGYYSLLASTCTGRRQGDCHRTFAENLCITADEYKRISKHFCDAHGHCRQ
jgi:hypothetical protein